MPVTRRSPVYFVTMCLFTILPLPTAMVDNFAGLLVVRFLQGFFRVPLSCFGGVEYVECGGDDYVMGLWE